jgi:SAM-dependent methyltransferase
MKQIIKKVPEFWNYLTEEQIIQIYESEIKHSNRLRISDSKKRKLLYEKVYEDYYSELPFHPAFKVKKNFEIQKNRLDFQLNKIIPIVNKNQVFVEVGAGDCALSKQLSSYVGKIYALEISKTYAMQENRLPSNMEIIIFDGFNFPFEANSIDFVYSNQLIEHLHPDDAIEQLKSIFNCLKKGGRHMIITPNRLLGPGDISGHFGDEPIGFHLKEYTDLELRSILKSVGFKKFKFQTIIKSKSIYIPFLIKWSFEKFFSKISKQNREKLLKYRIFNLFFNTVLIAQK